LNWSTGLQWREEYEKSNEPKKASVLAMLYGEGRNDMAGFVLRQPFAVDPGKVWRYSSGDSILLSYLLKTIYAGQDLQRVFREKIFEPIGAQDCIFEQDGAGNLAGAYYLHISPRDLARIGIL